MSTANTMSLTNSTGDTTLSVFFLVATNSGVDGDLVSGFDLAPGAATNQVQLNVDKGDTDTFFILFQDQNGTFWQSDGVVANLSSHEDWQVAVTLTDDPSGGLQMSINASGEGFGPWPIFQIATVSNDHGDSVGNLLNVYNGTDVTVTMAVYFGVATNSGQDIGVLAGTNLVDGPSSESASFTVDRGLTNTFMIFFVDQFGQPWWANGVECNLSSHDQTSVQLIVYGTYDPGMILDVEQDVWEDPTGPILQINNFYRPS